MLFSANLGFLWADSALPDAIRSAKAAGFDAVECHWPFETEPGEVKSALQETNMRMLGLNTSRGDLAVGENGLAALPGHEARAEAAFQEALDYALAVGAEAVHVMAGYAEGAEAHSTFVRNLRSAAARAEGTGITLLIEPMNPYDVPGYFLGTTCQARQVISDVASPNLKLMFDCYHIARTEGDLITRIRELFPLLGHIQFASVPDRGTPDHGKVDYRAVFAEIARLGWSRPLGAEYRPIGDTGDTLSWLDAYRDGR